jgi:hypothetical protein
MPDHPTRIDTSIVGQLAAETMESVERQFGADAEVGGDAATGG